MEAKRPDFWLGDEWTRPIHTLSDLNAAHLVCKKHGASYLCVERSANGMGLRYYVIRREGADEIIERMPRLRPVKTDILRRLPLHDDFMSL